MEKKETPKKEMAATEMSSIEKRHMEDNKDLHVHRDEPIIDPDYDFDVDIKDTIVQAIDGVIIEGDDDEIRLLFFYYKPDMISEEDGAIRCKCIAEFRVSRSNFIPIAKDLYKKARSLRTHHARISDHINWEKLSMYA